MSQIPRNLVTALKKRITVTPGQNKTDIEMVFNEGDVLKMRIQSIQLETNKIEFSMQPFRVDSDDEDDYVVEGRETEEELEEAEKESRYNQDDEATQYDPEDLLLWWKGESYVKTPHDETVAEVDEELEVIMESEKIVEGTWRRLFEIDLREDEADFSSKIFDAEQKELEDEIGELSGLDEEMLEDSIGLGYGYKHNRAGSFISLSSLPDDWKSQLEFIKDLEAEENIEKKGLRSGKKGESAELISLINKMEHDAQQAAANRSKRNPENSAIGTSGLSVDPSISTIPPAQE
jgi:hypothetical protein